MPIIHLETQIDVPVEVCFDLAQNLSRRRTYPGSLRLATLPC